MKQRIKQWWCGLRGKDPEAVVVSFRSGDDALSDAMCAEVQRLIPDRRHIEVRLEDLPGLRKRLRPHRIGLAPVLFTGDARYAPLRRAAFLLAPSKILAYNARLERHHLRLIQPIASWLFWRGVPLDRIFLRPGWLWPAFLKRPNDRTVRPAEHQRIEGRARDPQRPLVAVLSPYFPYPLSHGGAVRIFHLLRETARTFDVKLYAFTEAEIPDHDLEPVLEFVSRVYLVRKPRYREPRWSSLAPPEVCEYRSPEMQALWQKAEASLKQVEYTALASYGGDVLVEHDITFDLYAQVRARRRTLGAWWDWWRWRRYETSAVKQFRRITVMSPKDQEAIVEHALVRATSRLVSTPGDGTSAGMARTSACSTVVVENGVDLARFTPTQELPGRRLLFIGSFRHFPNITAFRFLAEEVFPLIPDAELTVVAGPDPWPHWQNHTGTLAPAPHPRIHINEFVADVRPLYQETNVVVVPTLESAGTNVKVLEALAMERAVISTASGCAGLDLEHRETAWIADSAAGLAEGIRTLLDDFALRLHIARAGRRHAERQFDWRAIGARQRALYSELLGDSVQIRPAWLDDLEAMAQIQAASPDASQWRIEDYLAHDCLVALTDGRVTGFLAIRTVPPSEHEILNLAVDPAHRRRGIARRLLQEALLTRPGDWFLDVRESNTAAQSLYKSLGFSPIGRRENYYAEPCEGAIVMRFFS
ncbi:MAG TPA: GNAT family N-acetyltransferase [Bryobacteraceae bacterium]|nr:GNAT family N-acetyltransferase [Bryobacteraceae bacterium]